MPKVLNAPDLITNLEAIAAQAPGWGAALRSIRERSGLSLETVARAVGRNRSSILNWQLEKHKAPLDLLAKALLAMGVDAQLIEKAWGGPIQAIESADPHADARSAERDITELLRSKPDATPDEVERAIHEKFGGRIIAAQAKKALAGDTRAAAFMTERADRLRRQKHSDGTNTSAAQFIQHPRSAIDTSIFEDEPERDEALSANTPENTFAPATPRDARPSAPEPIEEKPHGDPDGPFGAEPFVNAGDEQPSRRRGRSLIASLGLPSFT